MKTVENFDEIRLETLPLEKLRFTVLHYRLAKTQTSVTVGGKLKKPKKSNAILKNWPFVYGLLQHTFGQLKLTTLVSCLFQHGRPRRRQSSEKIVPLQDTLASALMCNSITT